MSRGRAWGADSRVPVEEWGAAPVGHPAYDLTVVEDAGRRALHMKSAGERSTIAKELARSRLIGYVCDPALPVGTVIPSRKTGAVTFIVARRGEPGLGQWHDERRNVADDYRTLFGEAPPPLPVLALSIDTNDTRAPAEALFGRIELRSG